MESAAALGDEDALSQKAQNALAASYFAGTLHEIGSDGVGLGFWYPPRLAPYEPELSDGDDLHATLGFLVDALEETIPETLRSKRAGFHESTRVLWHPMVAAFAETDHQTDHQTDHETKTLPLDESSEDASCVLRIRSVSGLTDMAYARLTIVCPACLRDTVARLVAVSRVGGMGLQGLGSARSEPLAESRALASVAPALFSVASDPDETHETEKIAVGDLLDVLVWCRFARLERGGDHHEPSRLERPAKRTRAIS
jgi:hypothetical protein